MTKEELIKDQFPNDEFLQSGVLRIVDKCTAELEKEKCELLGIIQGKDKAIKDLEKENANLKVLRKYEANVAKIEIEKLEKENVELKRDKEDLIFIRNQNAKCMCEDKENLVKAKELLAKWVSENPYTVAELIDLMSDTEQFLKDNEVEK